MNAFAGKTEEQLSKLFEKIGKALHNGNELTPINKELYDQYSKLLSGAITAEMPIKKDLSLPTPPGMIQSLRTNIFKFSGGKSLSAMAAMRAKLLNADGKIKPWNEFRKDILALDAKYNKTWLRTEYDTAIGTARMVDQFNRAQADENVKYLTWVAVSDEMTCPICGPLNGICLPKEDPFWQAYWPLLHFKCRCRIDESTSSAHGASITDSETAHKVAKESKIPQAFQGNTAIDGEIYDESHPYFEDENMNTLDAVKTYNMKQLSTIADAIPSDVVPDEWTDKTYAENYKEMVKSIDEVETPSGSVAIDNTFNHYILNELPAEAPELLNVLESPNEIWDTTHKSDSGEITTTSWYIRYYDGIAIAVEVENDLVNARAKSIISGGLTDTGEISKLRKGILMYTN